MIDNWRGDELIQAIELAFIDANEDALDEVKQEIQDVKWDWPNDTLRKSGEIARSPRSVVDTGEFYLRTTGFQIDDTTFEFKSDPIDPDTGEHYALNVILGSKGKPGRNVYQIPIYENLFPGFINRASKLIDEIK